jgi:hypothetical protein
MTRRRRAASDGLIVRTIPNLVNGMSQQPAAIRLKSQAADQQNCLSNVADGVSRRPPSEHLKMIEASPPTEGYHVHTIDRDTGERYVMTIEDGAVRVFDVTDGTEMTVGTSACTKTAGDVDYLASTDPRGDFAAVTIADYTFIANKTITCAMSSTLTAARPNEFVCHVKRTVASHDIQITIGAYPIGHTPAGTDTDTSAQNLYNLLVGSGSLTNWTFTRWNNMIYGVQNSGTDQLVSAQDDYGNTCLSLAYKKIQNFSDLPERGEDGFVTEITGDETSAFDNYFVEYNEDDTVWQETQKRGLYDSFDADTMPHQLRRTPAGGNDFELEPITWGSRTCGDENSAPEPTFIGRTINDVLLHKNRLCFLTDENVVMSESSEFFNFFPTTVTTLVDSDPIDIAASSNRVSLLDFGIPFQRNLTLFSKTGGMQAELVGSDIEDLTVTNARIEERAAFEMAAVRPVALGKLLYFVVDRDARSGIMEYGYLDEVADAADITAHIAELMPANIFKIAGSGSQNMLVALSSDDPDTLYVYRFWFSGNDKMMASWSVWNFGTDDEILNIDFIGDSLYMLVERDDGVHLEKLDLESLDDGLLGHRCHLDSLCTATGVYVSGTDTTTWTLPYDQEGGVFEVVRSGAAGWGDDKGQTIPNIDYTTTAGVITVTGDFSDASCLIGRKFESLYEPSQVVLDDGGGDQSKPFLSGRLQIRRWKVLYKNTGKFDVYVTHREDDDYEYEYEFVSRIVDHAPIGPTELTDGTFEFDVGGSADGVQIKFKSDSFLPFTFTSMEWEAFYFHRAQRV